MKKRHANCKSRLFVYSSYFTIPLAYKQKETSKKRRRKSHRLNWVLSRSLHVTLIIIFLYQQTSNSIASKIILGVDHSIRVVIFIMI